jgi:uncharacterized protein YqgV (UPF0045/DUF77 family)
LKKGKKIQFEYLLDTTRVLTRVLTRHNSSIYSSINQEQIEKRKKKYNSNTYSTQLEYLLEYSLDTIRVFTRVLIKNKLKKEKNTIQILTRHNSSTHSTQFEYLLKY